MKRGMSEFIDFAYVRYNNYSSIFEIYTFAIAFRNEEADILKQKS